MPSVAAANRFYSSASAPLPSFSRKRPRSPVLPNREDVKRPPSYTPAQLWSTSGIGIPQKLGPVEEDEDEEDEEDYDNYGADEDVVMKD
jgi:hypothetical protein